MMGSAATLGAAAAIMFALSMSLAIRGVTMLSQRRARMAAAEACVDPVSPELRTRIGRIRETEFIKEPPEPRFMQRKENLVGGERRQRQTDSDGQPLLLDSPAEPGAKLDRQPQFAERPCVRRALKAIFDGDPFIEIGGPPGSGKQALVDHVLRTDTTTRQVVLAPRTRDAMKAGGQSLRDFFGLPARFLDEEALAEHSPARAWKEVRRIIIIGVSQVRADMLDAIDTRLRRAQKPDAPFGGVQIVCVGEYFQQPAALGELDRRKLAQHGYANGYAFSAKALGKTRITAISLDPPVKPRDADFAGLLEGLRSSPTDSLAVDTLNKRCVHPHRTGTKPLVLVGLGSAADGYNAGSLAALHGPACTFVAESRGDFEPSRDAVPAPQALFLKPGARVMAVSADPAGAWTEGAIGTVSDVRRESVAVRFDGASVAVQVRRRRWRKIRYVWDQDEQRIVPGVVGDYSQVPLRLAWALTVDDAPRLSLEDVRVDFGEGDFKPDQAWTAVSRARTLGGLSLSRPFTVADFYVDPAVVRHYAETGRPQPAARAPGADAPEQEALPWDDDLFDMEDDELHLPMAAHLPG